VYSVLYIDPPYSYNNRKTGGSMKSASNQHYPVMTDSDLVSLKIFDIADEDAVLFLWVTNPMLEKGLGLMDIWGFEYKTMITWVKTNCLGMGAWFRGNTEHILVGMKGDVKAFKCQSKNYIEHPVQRHSEKPEIFRKLIEKATKNMPSPTYLELFGRKKVEGWKVLGLEYPEKNISEELASFYI
jgi:N6-adenosine-specific RNA methylase IME4